MCGGGWGVLEGPHRACGTNMNLFMNNGGGGLSGDNFDGENFVRGNFVTPPILVYGHQTQEGKI